MIRKLCKPKALIALLLIVGLLVAFTVYADTQTKIAQFEPNVDITGNATHVIYNKEIAAQTFTPQVTHDVSYIAIYGYITGDPSYILVQLRTTSGDTIATAQPTKNLLYHWFGSKSSATVSSAFFTGNESGSWYMAELDQTAKLEAGTVYAVVVKAPAGDSDDSFNWYYNDDGNEYVDGATALGARVTSSNDGSSWTVQDNDNFMFQTWGESGLLIQSVNVYKSFYETDDWLIVASYLNKAPTYYKIDDIEQYFRLQLIENTSSTIVGESVLRSWDASVASIYLNTAEVSDLEWETGNFTLRIQSTYGGEFYVDYNLTASNFAGDTLSFLDRWCISQAQWMGTMNKGDDMYYLRETAIGLVLNEKGIQQFDLGIPRLGTTRGEYIYETYIDEAVLSGGELPDPQLQSKYDWETQLGPGLVGSLDDVGGAFNLSGKLIALVVIAVLYLFAVGTTFPAGHGAAGAGIGFFIVLIGMVAGVVDVVWVILAGVLMLAMALRQLILIGQ